MRRGVFAVVVISCVALATAQPLEFADPVPADVAGFQRAAEQILRESGVPGAGIALVRSDGPEWVGGVGLADRDRNIPVTAHTAFRVGSISKSFVALALVQLYEDGFVDLDTPVRELAPEVVIDNPWEETSPVRVIHLLQHTAGFDDMHFNETYVPSGEPDRPLAEVLRINPRSRQVRWRPGTRMAYSNPGYAIAGLLIEKIAGEPYEDYIANEIFEPLGMVTSSFRFTAEDGDKLAQGYEDGTGPPTGFPHIYLRPAGNMYSSAHDMARFVQMLLNWGELDTAFVVDPEYLGTMELPQTALASRAGLRSGYATGIYATLDLPYPMLGHNGGIAGFISTYGYSPSRDVGYVILLNSTGPGASGALRRLSRLAVRHLKRDVEPAEQPEATLDPSTLDRYVGYYHDASPRNQIVWPIQSLFSGQTVVREGEQLYVDPVFGDRQRLVPVGEATFRFEHEVDASRVFTLDDDGGMVLAGAQTYAERMPRWRMEMIRLPIALAALLTLSVLLAMPAWLFRLRRARPRGFWALKSALVLCPLTLLLPIVALMWTPMTALGQMGPATTTVFVTTLAVPLLALLVGLLALAAAREGASRTLVTYAAAVSLAMGVLSVYMSSHGLLGMRLWTY